MRLLFRSLGLASSVLVTVACGSGLDTRTDTADVAPDRFPCGSHGGSCARDTQLCVVGDKCSACVDIPASCTANPTCACLPPGNDPSLGNIRCDDPGVCTEDGGGQVLTCKKRSLWTCG